MKRVRIGWGAVLLAAVVAACGGGEVLAVLSFLGSAGGDWKIADPAATGFKQLSTCGTDNSGLGTGVGTGNDLCVVNIQIQGGRDLFATAFDARYSGNLKGCPPRSSERLDGKIVGNVINLPGCFTGRYVTINAAVSDDGTKQALFDTEVPEVSTGVWVEIHQGTRRFKFGNVANQRCELTTPRTPATLTITPANLGNQILHTTVTLSVGGQTWSGRFEGVSGLALTRAGGERLDLQRRDLPDTCI